MADRIVKCRYKYCSRKHESKELPVSEAINPIPKFYYHKDCYSDNEDVKEIVRLWTDRIDSSPMLGQLYKTIFKLSYDDAYTTQYLLFALRFCLDHGWNLRYPAGLSYVAKDRDAQEAWQKQKHLEALRNVSDEMFKVDEAETPIPEFQYKGTKRGFNRILK